MYNDLLIFADILVSFRLWLKASTSTFLESVSIKIHLRIYVKVKVLVFLFFLKMTIVDFR